MMDDLNELRAMAEAQSEAYQVMEKLGGGVGQLGVERPDLYQKMYEWDVLSDNGFADVVLSLLDRIYVSEWELYRAVEDRNSWYDDFMELKKRTSDRAARKLEEIRMVLEDKS